MSADHERDLMRVEQMMRLIDDYERKSISLGAFLQQFDTLLGALESVDPQWIGDLKGEWWTLEQVFAASKEPDLRMPEAQAATLIADALRNMRGLLSPGPRATP